MIHLGALSQKGTFFASETREQLDLYMTMDASGMKTSYLMASLDIGAIMG